ncbi:DNA-directed RNA polymerase subunit delta [Tannockella kyphosi]|uniref:DNA-directed RNA polymerase subunit delta n=1 Tax=Tannockella kyphosi TaxID=2899121 RepID=UPI00201147CE|nr:DNA-directed RNA polymerase subunit delta [Tannockella kyphosi]
MNNKSMVDVAFELMSAKKKPMAFQKLFTEITEIKGFTPEEHDEKISLFYTNITLDGRFITVGENQWDLRSRHNFAAVHIDMNDIYAEEEEVDVEIEEPELIANDFEDE